MIVERMDEPCQIVDSTIGSCRILQGYWMFRCMGNNLSDFVRISQNQNTVTPTVNTTDTFEGCFVPCNDYAIVKVERDTDVFFSFTGANYVVVKRIRPEDIPVRVFQVLKG